MRTNLDLWEMQCQTQRPQTPSSYDYKKGVHFCKDPTWFLFCTLTYAYEIKRPYQCTNKVNSYCIIQSRPTEHVVYWLATVRILVAVQNQLQPLYFEKNLLEKMVFHYAIFLSLLFAKLKQ